MKLRKALTKSLSIRSFSLRKGKSSSKLTSDETEEDSMDRNSAALGEAESKRGNLKAGRTEERSSCPARPTATVSSVLRNTVGDLPRSATERRLTATPDDGRVSFSMEDNKYVSYRVFKQGKLVRPASTFQIVPNALDIDSDEDDASYTEQGGEDGGEENERGMSMSSVPEESSPPAQDGDFVDGSLDALLAAARTAKEDQPCAEDDSAANKESPSADKDDTEFVDGSLDALCAAAMKAKDQPNADDDLGGVSNEEPSSENEDTANKREQESEEFVDGSLDAVLAAAMRAKDQPNADDDLGGLDNENPSSENEDTANKQEQESEEFVDGSLDAVLAAAMKTKDQPNEDDDIGGTGNEPSSDVKESANSQEQESEEDIANEEESTLAGKEVEFVDGSLDALIAAAMKAKSQEVKDSPEVEEPGHSESVEASNSPDAPDFTGDKFEKEMGGNDNATN